VHSLHAGFRYFRAGAGKAGRQVYSYVRRARMRRQRVGAYAPYSQHAPQCLHIGAEIFAIPGWFNTDLDPRSEGIYFLDATLPFPFPDASFDFVFSEHMIEHIPFADGLKMLAECRRILQPGGVIRTATPNLRNILALISSSNGNEAYLNWAVEQFKLPKEPFPKAPSVINNFFRAWGHQFIYDPGMLQTAMEQAGFGEVVQCEIGVSRHSPLQGLERHGERWSPWINKFETMVLEGTATGSEATRDTSRQMAVAG
jgi:predicted SAM-dependent methyltransferase